MILFTSIENIYIFLNGCTDVCLSVSLSVGMLRSNQNPNPWIDRDEILYAFSQQSKKGFGAGLTPAPSLPGAGVKTLTAEWHIFENGLQNKRCSADCKLTRAAPGTSASCGIRKM